MEYELHLDVIRKLITSYIKSVINLYTSGQFNVVNTAILHSLFRKDV